MSNPYPHFTHRELDKLKKIIKLNNEYLHNNAI